LLAGVELATEGTPPDGGLGPYCVAKAQERGLLVRALGDTIAFCPPLIIDRQEIGQLVDRFAAALDDTRI
ncbi:MAG: aspartate aminotransferase family protein, partial [Alphaproteobacteria bacterium]|nr:aspartate aminotransferase family protein [Alphaproteobacteria bacterium]